MVSGIFFNRAMLFFLCCLLILFAQAKAEVVGPDTPVILNPEARHPTIVPMGEVSNWTQGRVKECRHEEKVCCRKDDFIAELGLNREDVRIVREKAKCKSDFADTVFLWFCPRYFQNSSPSCRDARSCK